MGSEQPTKPRSPRAASASAAVRAALVCVSLVAAPPAHATPHVDYHGGHLLTAPRFTTLYWGSYWADPARAPLIAYVDGFMQAEASSPRFYSALYQYSASGARIGPGSFTGSVVAPADPAPAGGSIRDGAIDEFLETQMDAGLIPKPTANQVYVVFMPPDVTITNVRQKSNINFCAYHEGTITVRGTGGVQRRIVVAYPDHAACDYVSPLHPADPIGANLTKTLSHEMAESVTDPDAKIGSYGWLDWSNGGGEIGDFCAGTAFVRQLDGYYVQAEWSNAAGACALDGPKPSDTGGCPAGLHAEGDYCFPDVGSGCEVATRRRRASPGPGHDVGAGLAAAGLLAVFVRRGGRPRIATDKR